MSEFLLLPGDPEFSRILATPPPNWSHFARSEPDFAFVVRADTGLLEPVGQADLDEYLEGGEYDDRLAEIEESNDAGDDWYGVD